MLSCEVNLMTRLSWNELFSQDSSLDFARIFGSWPDAFGKVMPIGMSVFGDVFYAKPDESVWRLDSFTGESRQVAASQDEFSRFMNSEPWQIENLRTELVLSARDKGLKRGPAQVFAPVPPPTLSGGRVPSEFVVMDAVVWHHISSQTIHGAANAPRDPSGDGRSKPWWKVW